MTDKTKTCPTCEGKKRMWISMSTQTDYQGEEQYNPAGGKAAGRYGPSSGMKWVSIPCPTCAGKETVKG